MTMEKDPHLDESVLLLAAVDVDDLPESAREHLSACPVCRAAREHFEKSLSQLGRMAEEFAPKPSKKIFLPPAEGRLARPWWLEWRYVRAASAAAMTALLIVLGSIAFWPSQESLTAKLRVEMREDAKLMREISRLEEDPLPALYSQMSDEADEDLSDDFIEFVVPDPSSTPVSYNRREMDSLC